MEKLLLQAPYPTGGQWLPYRGHDTVKTTFLPFPFALSKRSQVQTPRLAKKFAHKFLKGGYFFHSCQISFQIFLPCSFCLVSQLEALLSSTSKETKISRDGSIKTCSHSISRDYRPKPCRTCPWCAGPSLWRPSRTSSPTRPTGNTRTPRNPTTRRHTFQSTLVRK